MPALSDYVTGTITLTNGSAAFTGNATGWLLAGFKEGDTILDVAGASGRVGVIASITSNTAGTLSKAWEGPTLTNVAYRMRYQPDGARVSAQARNLIELLGNGNLQAEALVDGTGGNWLSYFTGAGTKDRTALTAFARTLLDDADGATARATLGANDASNLNAGTIPDARLSATLTSDKAFRRGNILGTVSQTGGVPTGALIESGSNASGRYVRYANGLQICHVYATFCSAPCDLALGSIFRSIALPWNFPAAFSEVPVVSGMAANSDRWLTVDPPSSSQVVVRQMCPYSDAVGRAPYLMTVGRWF